jgi:RNA polymerase sigma-70 factor, ECF subfamily
LESLYDQQVEPKGLLRVKASAEHVFLAGTADWADDSSPLQREVSAAFEQLRDPVYWYLFGIIKDAAESEDLTQETFLRLFRDLHSGQKISNTRGWLFRVAHNLALSKLRQRTVLQPGERVEYAPTDSGLNPEQAAIASEIQRGIERVLGRLSAQESQCLLLRSEGLRYREIAQILDIKISTVAVFLARAISKITDGVHG